MTEVTTFLTAALGWAGEIVEFVFTTEPLNYFVYVGLIGAVVGIVAKTRHAL